MRQSNNNILEDYRHADAEIRLYLFLEHRSLRRDFIKIEQEQTQPGMVPAAAEGKIHRRRGRNSIFWPFRQMLKWCHSVIP